MKPSELTTTNQSKPKFIKLRILFFIVLVIITILAILTVVFLPQYIADHSVNNTDKIAAEVTPVEQARQQILDAKLESNATVEQQYILLMSKVNTSTITQDWVGVENYVQQVLNLEGHSDDMAALTQLAPAQKNLGKTADYKKTLQRIKAYLDKSGSTNNDYYRNITEELSK